MGAYEFQGSPPTILYVNQAIAASGDGTSWATAFKTLQEALQLSCPSVTQIWAAKGTYYPSLGVDVNQDGTTAREVTFQLFEGVKLYGGFSGNGTETMLSQRNVAANVTTLSGDIGDADNSDNAYHVVYTTGVTAATVLDGFTITAANANIPFGLGSYNLSGGGMLNLSGSSPTIANCTFAGNSASSFGGGMFNSDNSSPNATNCAFSGNSAGGGGAMFNGNNSSLTLVNCTFSGNSVGDGAGGAMHNVNTSSPKLTNCTFSGNSAAFGGAIFNLTGSSPILKNCIVWNNKEGNVTSTSGASIFNRNGSLFALSSPLISYSIIANSGGSGGGWVTAVGTDGGNNKNSDPLFIDPDGADNIVGTADDNLSLSICSPAINAGTNTGAPATDIVGNVRPFVGTVSTADMGAYEYQGNPAVITVTTPTVTQPTCAVPTGTIVVNATATGGGTLEYSIDNGSNWQSSVTFSGLAAGNYDLKVRLQTSQTCEVAYASNPVVLTALPSVTAGALSSDVASICQGGSADISHTGSTGTIGFVVFQNGTVIGSYASLPEVETFFTTASSGVYCVYGFAYLVTPGCANFAGFTLAQVIAACFAGQCYNISDPLCITVNSQPVSPTLNVKTPNVAAVCFGTGVSATFTAGSGGVGCSDDYTVSIDGAAAVA